MYETLVKHMSLRIFPEDEIIIQTDSMVGCTTRVDYLRVSVSSRIVSQVRSQNP